MMPNPITQLSPHWFAFMFHKKEAFDVIDATDPLVVEEQKI